MDYRIFGDNPLSQPMVVYCQLYSEEHISMIFCLHFKSFHSRKCIGTRRLQKNMAILPRPRYVKREPIRAPYCRRLFQFIFFIWRVLCFASIWLKFISKGPTNTQVALVRIMASRLLGRMPIYEPMILRRQLKLYLRLWPWNVKLDENYILLWCHLQNFAPTR